MQVLKTKNNSLITNKRGFSFIDVIVGIAILATVFWGVFGVFRLGIENIFNNKAKAGAIALANEQVEFIRSLSYDDVGTVGGIPTGDIFQEEEVVLNNVNYNVRTFIQYVDDENDGEGVNDENGITADYKRVKVEVSWSTHGKDKSTSLVTSIVPKGMESIDGGGTLAINVFDALGGPVISAQVHIENNELDPPISLDAFSNDDGGVIFPGSPEAINYEITVSKDGYSTAQTYDLDEQNVSPTPGHLSVMAGEKTTASFSIDKLSSRTVETYSAIAEEVWTDLFDDISKISDSGNIVVDGGDAELSIGELSGFVKSISVEPEYLNQWIELSWNDSLMEDTNIIYQLYYINGLAESVLVSDTDLPGNDTGFATSTVDLSGLDISTYDNLQLFATLSTTNASSTPSLLDWQLNYLAGPKPLPSISFNMRGDKTIGSDSDGAPIYKYSEDLQTDLAGILNIVSLEWDSYVISIDNAALGLDISEICEPQPFSLEPDTSVTTKITPSPHTTNSLLVSVKNNSGSLLSGAQVRLYRGTIDQSEYSSDCGQVFFDSLSSGTVSGGDPYSVDVTLVGYEDTTIAEVDVSGASTLSVTLSQL